MEAPDAAVRAAAFRWLADRVAAEGEVLPWSLIHRGFEINGDRVPLVSQQGIFKPRVCELPLSIRTSVGGPYDDRPIGGRLAYRYRGTDPRHRDNVGLRQAKEAGAPLVYFLGVSKGWYLTTFPVLVVGDEPESLRFWVQVESTFLGGASLTGPVAGASPTEIEIDRVYATREVYVRLHQAKFRERVLAAYKDQCAMCRLRHRNLLDAAHILPDSEGGKPVVPNGLSLCKIHHAAFDRSVIGVHPTELRVHVRDDVLREIDGPMLQHGLQELHGERVLVPRSSGKRPDLDGLRWRWERFRDAC